MKTNWSYVGPDQGNASFPQNLSDFKKLYTGNTGNLMYYYATRCCISFRSEQFGFGTSTDVINSSKNGLIFSLANQLGSHIDLSKRGMKLAGLKVPLIGLGLGAQIKEATDDISFIPKGTIDWIRELTNRSITDKPNLTVRGDYTLSILEKIGLSEKAVSIGCQTNFINPNKKLGRSIVDRLGDTGIRHISVAASSPFNRSLQAIENCLLNISIKTKGKYIVQHPIDMISLCTNYSKDSFEDSLKKVYKFYASPNMTIENFRDIIRTNFEMYVDPVQWMLNHHKSDVVVGTRIHGIQSALQAGVPAICLYHDSRTKELCYKMKIPCADIRDYVSGIDELDIERIIKSWDFEEFDKNRVYLAKEFFRFLKFNEVNPSRRLLELSH